MDIIPAMPSSATGQYPYVNMGPDQCAKIGYFLLFSAIFSWRVVASQYYVLMSGFAGHTYSWLAIARQEKNHPYLGVNGYNSKNRK